MASPEEIAGNDLACHVTYAVLPIVAVIGQVGGWLRSYATSPQALEEDAASNFCSIAAVYH